MDKNHALIYSCPEPGLRVNDISRIHWSEPLLTTQSERPNSGATRLGDHPASIVAMIFPLSNCNPGLYCLRKQLNGMSISSCLKIPEGSELTNIVARDAKIVAKLATNLVAKNDANNAKISPSSY
ncbi:hypothetical protein TNCV_1100321 [Trichonephila clavipes]|nr:hypothetical protein TNCV_1100321 [Trichonephila clavipes]